jgi:hypothetical protein
MDPVLKPLSPIEDHPILDWIRAHIDHAITPLAELEKAAVLDAMILCRGNIKLAAMRLGITPKTLYRKLAQYRQADSLRARITQAALRAASDEAIANAALAALQRTLPADR